MTCSSRSLSWALLAMLVVAACGGDDSDPVDTRRSCDDCDPATQYCQKDIVDGPSTVTCEPIPATCTATPDCDCIVPLTCPHSLESCEPDDDGLIVVECVVG